MSSQIDMTALANSIAEEQRKKDDLYNSMGATVKELVNLLLPADYVVGVMERTAERIDGTNKVAVRRDELDSVVQLVTNAHLLASRLQSILDSVGLQGQPQAQPQAAAAVAEQLAAPRVRDDSWRKEPREPIRPVKAA